MKIIIKGFSRVLVKDHFTKSFCGSLQTVAPEIIEGKPYNNKVDIYSLGCVIY